MSGDIDLSPTGWVRVAGDPVGSRLETDYEGLFAETMAAIAEKDWGTAEPFFEELNIRVRYPAADLPLGIGNEAVSVREALHEEFYFSLLELFLGRAGRRPGDRTARPGQIVPDVEITDGLPSVLVETRPLSLDVCTRPDQMLDTARAALSVDQVEAELHTIGGLPFSAQSRSSRAVPGRYIRGSEAAVMISGGQHANETTGIIGALRAAHRLKARPGAHFTIAPLENPDGYALQLRLTLNNPAHMHHAARYTAYGDDLEYRSGGTAKSSGEHQIRQQAQALTGARLHVNLHGYPSHEWTRPLSGYIPRGFAAWTLPKGFFLILRHHPDWRSEADALLDRVTRALAKCPGLLDANKREIELHDAHAGGNTFHMVNGFPCQISFNASQPVPVTLITEYPDETILGDEFVRGHTAQMATVIAAYEAWQAIAATSCHFAV